MAGVCQALHKEHYFKPSMYYQLYCKHRKLSSINSINLDFDLDLEILILDKNNDLI